MGQSSMCSVSTHTKGHHFSHKMTSYKNSKLFDPKYFKEEDEILTPEDLNWLSKLLGKLNSHPTDTQVTDMKDVKDVKDVKVNPGVIRHTSCPYTPLAFY